MADVGDIVRAAFRIVTKQSDEPTASEMADGIEALNHFRYELFSGGFGHFDLTQDTHTLSSGTANYTIGSGATIDTTRPLRIINAFIRDGSTDFPVTIVSSERYASRRLKSTTGIPRELYYLRSNTTGTIYLYPTPDSAYTLYLESEKPPTAYTSSDDTITEPPEYEVAFKWNLAVEIAPEYGADVTQVMATRAISTLRTIKRLHSQPVPQLNTDPFSRVGRSYDIDGDTYI